MEANLEEIVLDDSIVVVQEGPAEKEDNGNATITLDDTLESLESTDSKQWDKEQKQRKEEIRKIEMEIERNQKDIETLKEIQKLEDDIRRTEEIKEAIKRTMEELQKTRESSVEESEDEEDSEVDEVFPGEADWDMSLEVMPSPTSSQLLDSSAVGSIILMSPPTEEDDSVIILSPEYAPPSPRTPFSSWHPVYPTPETRRRRSSSLSPRRPPTTTNGKKKRRCSSSPRVSPRASPISPLTVSLLTTPEGRGNLTPPISSSSPVNLPRLSTEPRLVRPLQKRHASPPFLGPRPRNIFRDEDSGEEEKEEAGKSGQGEGPKRRREEDEECSDGDKEEERCEEEEKKEKKGEKEKEEKEKVKEEMKEEEEESRGAKSGVWHVDIDSAETVWKQIFKDLEEAAKGSNPLLNRGWVKLVNPDHPAIKLRTTYLSWGTRHEDLAPSGPSVVVPMTVECLKTIDYNLIGQDTEPTLENLEVFEVELRELLEEEENINMIVFSTISSYSKGNPSKLRDCINRLFMTPMEVRWLNLHTNTIMALEEKEVTWPIDTHVGLYHPEIFRSWLDRKMRMEGRTVMSLVDQARRMIQERINPNLSPYLKSCPCVYWA